MISIRCLDRLKMYEDQDGIASYAERAIRKVINMAERTCCQKLDVTRLGKGKKLSAPSVVVSMTTFPARISYVHLAIKSLLNQSVKPGKIILWLAKDQFQDVEIPGSLKALCSYGLELRYCEEDLLAHKKYYYAMQQYPEKIVVTYDDDIIYPEDSLEKLLEMHTRYPDAIVCNRGREIRIAGNAVAAYRHWKISGQIPAGTPSDIIMASTGAGTLYPPHCMPQETFDIEKIKTLALTADDLWMKVMSIKGRIPVVKSQTRNKGLCVSKARQDVTLAHRNVDQNLNDRVMEDLLSHYPDVKRTLLESVKGV